MGVLFHLQRLKKPSEPKDIVLSIKNLEVDENRGVPAVKGLSLDVRAGEIVGIAGIDGNGQSELIQAITGLRKVKSGSIMIKKSRSNTFDFSKNH